MCLSHDKQYGAPSCTGAENLHWYDNGQVALRGELLAQWQSLDTTFREWGSAHAAEDIQFPSFIAVHELQKMHYLQSFPHLATFAVNVSREQGALLRFSQQPIDARDESVRLNELEPVREVLTPAACYHIYLYLQGQELERAQYITTRNTCYRKEAYYVPLQRQWAFNMREQVCLGGEQEVDRFLEHYQQKISNYARQCGLDASWQAATDPFFLPEQNASYLAQRLFPVKQELVLDNGLAIASLNRHAQHFGRHFNIAYQGQAAFSGCVAFGLERWLYAMQQDGLVLARQEEI